MFEIRRATVADAEILADLRVAFLVEIAQAAGKRDIPDTADLRTALLQYFLDNLPGDTFLAWVAEAEGRIIGTSGLVLSRRPPTFKNLTGLDAYIMNMYTLPDWRGQGVASRLLQQAIDYAGAMGAKVVSLHATMAGRPLYEKRGFVSPHDAMELTISPVICGIK